VPACEATAAAARRSLCSRGSLAARLERERARPSADFERVVHIMPGAVASRGHGMPVRRHQYTASQTSAVMATPVSSRRPAPPGAQPAPCCGPPSPPLAAGRRAPGLRRDRGSPGECARARRGPHVWSATVRLEQPAAGEPLRGSASTTLPRPRHLWLFFRGGPPTFLDSWCPAGGTT